MEFEKAKVGAKVLRMMMAVLLVGSMCLFLQTTAPEQAQAAGNTKASLQAAEIAKVSINVKAAPKGKLTLNKGKKAKLRASATKGAKVTYKSSNAGLCFKKCV